MRSWRDLVAVPDFAVVHMHDVSVCVDVRYPTFYPQDGESDLHVLCTWNLWDQQYPNVSGVMVLPLLAGVLAPF